MRPCFVADWQVSDTITQQLRGADTSTLLIDPQGIKKPSKEGCKVWLIYPELRLIVHNLDNWTPNIAGLFGQLT